MASQEPIYFTVDKETDVDAYSLKEKIRRGKGFNEYLKYANTFTEFRPAVLQLLGQAVMDEIITYFRAETNDDPSEQYNQVRLADAAWRLALEHPPLEGEDLVVYTRGSGIKQDIERRLSYEN